MSDLDLIVDRLESVGGVLRVYAAGQVPTTPGSAYAVVSLDTGGRASSRVDGRSPNRVYRIAVQLVSQSTHGVLDLAKRADEALYDQRLTEFDDAPFCWREIATAPMRDPDAGGAMYALHTYSFRAGPVLVADES